MVLYVFLLIFICLIITLSIIYNKKIREMKNNIETEYLNLKDRLPNFKKKNALTLLFSSIITLMIFTLPISLIVILYLQFPVRMIFGQINLILTYLCLLSLFIVFDLIRIKILNSYIIVANSLDNNLNIPLLNNKQNLICNLLNPLNTGLYAALVIAIMILLK